MSTKTENSVLKKLFLNKAIKIEAGAGQKTIARSVKVFKDYLDPDFKNWHLDNQQRETKEIMVEVYEIIDDATFETMFASLDQDLDKLCLTQDQIVDFCQTHKELLHPHWATFFLFKERGKYFIARVDMSPDGLIVNAYNFKVHHIWYGGYHHYLVVPAIS